MISRILSPATAMMVAILLGVAAGPVWYWVQATAIAKKAAAIRQVLVAEEQSKVEQRKAHGWDFWTVEMENLASELKEQKAALEKKTDELNQRDEKIKAEGLELDRTRADVEAIRAEIDQRVIAIHADEAKNLRTLANTYSTLDAPAAVEIIKEMDDTTVTKILYLMKPDAVGQIFSAMVTAKTADGNTMAKRAAELSERIRLMRSGQVAAASPPPTP